MGPRKRQAQASGSISSTSSSSCFGLSSFSSPSSPFLFVFSLLLHIFILVVASVFVLVLSVIAILILLVAGVSTFCDWVYFGTRQVVAPNLDSAADVGPVLDRAVFGLLQLPQEVGAEVRRCEVADDERLQLRQHLSVDRLLERRLQLRSLELESGFLLLRNVRLAFIGSKSSE